MAPLSRLRSRYIPATTGISRFFTNQMRLDHRPDASQHRRHPEADGRGGGHDGEDRVPNLARVLHVKIGADRRDLARKARPALGGDSSPPRVNVEVGPSGAQPEGGGKRPGCREWSRKRGERSGRGARPCEERRDSDRCLPGRDRGGGAPPRIPRRARPGNRRPRKRLQGLFQAHPLR